MVLEFSGLLHLAVVVFVTVSVAGSRASALRKTLWILGVFLFPVVGAIVWLVFGPRGRV